MAGPTSKRNGDGNRGRFKAFNEAYEAWTAGRQRWEEMMRTVSVGAPIDEAELLRRVREMNALYQAFVAAADPVARALRAAS